MGNRTCSVEGCERPHECKGFCGKHYRRWRLYGDPSVRHRGGKPPLTEEAFWAKVAKGDGCWEWQGARSASGYGVARWQGRDRPAHRIAYEFVHGPVPLELEMDHLCRNRGCVNPAHLEPVTGRENVLRSPIAIPAINARMTTCKAGHPLVPSPWGRQRWCPVCRANYKRPPRKPRGRHEPPKNPVGTTCHRGHELTGDNLRYAHGQRVCVACANDNQRRRRAAAKAMRGTL